MTEATRGKRLSDMTPEDNLISEASQAYQNYRAWYRSDRRGLQGRPHPTGSEVLLLALGIPLDGRGTPEQEHLWGVLADKAIDLADDRKVLQPPRMLRYG